VNKIKIFNKNLAVVFFVMLSSTALMAEEFKPNFKDADIKDVIKFVADATGYTVVVDPKVKGRVDLITSEHVSEDDMYNLFLTVLQTHGFAAVRNGNVLRIIPDKEARSASTPVVKSQPRGENADFVTQIIELKNVNASKLIPVLRPLVPQQGHMAAYADANAIIISDTADNVKKIYEIIQSLDKTTANEMEIFKLKHSSVEEFMKIVEKVLNQSDGGGGKKGGSDSQASVVADKRSNSIIVTGSDKQRSMVKTLIEKLDGPLESSGNAQVFQLKYAKAKDLAPILAKVAQSLTKISSDAAKAKGGEQSASIEADEASNALIITASGDVMEGIQNIIKQLDMPRKQVLVEAIIVEMVADDGKSLGVDWMVAGKDQGFGASNNSSALEGLVGAGGFDEDPEDALTGIGTALASAAGGVLGGLTYDVNDTSFAAVITALETNREANILSTPSLMTLDNNEAQIVVGQEVPFVTGSYTSTGSSGSNPGDPFQTVERENVGITLKVTPHVNEGGQITLDISQEVSGLVGNASEIADGPIVTNERKIETSVATGDGETIVLGGLMRDEIQESISKVPILGDLPLVGRLFKSSSTGVRKTNLMVFIRPTVINNSARALEVSEEQYRLVRDKQLYKKARGVDLFDEDVLPTLPTWEERVEDLEKIRSENQQLDQDSSEEQTQDTIDAVEQAEDTADEAGDAVSDSENTAETET
jgi:general secretion pathway protein D